jgi:cation-transporting ATPase I
VGVNRLFQSVATLPPRGVSSAVDTAGAAISAGIGIATMPARLLARAVPSARTVASTAQVVAEAFGANPRRRCWRGNGRSWIEVRGLDDPQCRRAVGALVLEAVRAQPGVTKVQLNCPLSRIIVWCDVGEPTLRTLCDIVTTAEQQAHCGTRTRRDHPSDLPGDGVVLAANLAAATVSAAGLCAVAAGRALMWPRLPGGLAAAVTVVDYQPRLRRLVEDRLGPSAADTALAVAASAVYTLTQAPASLAVELLIHLARTAESRSGSRAWEQREPALATHADCSDGPAPSPRPRPRPPGPVERHADRCGLAQAVAMTVVGTATRSVNAAATAAVVAAPKAARTARESFASTLGRGLADQHGVLPLRPESLRRLDRVDVVLIDPRVLFTDELRLSRIRAAPDHERAAAWQWAQAQLDRGALQVGWQEVPRTPTTGRNGRSPVEVLVRNTHHLLASAVVAEARNGSTEVVCLDVEALDDLRSAFDDLRPISGSVESALAAAVRDLQEDGRTVAVLSSSAAQALSAADVSIGIISSHDPPPWHAHLLVDDLAGAWQVLRALPAARKASRRGVEIASGASLLGALLMVPGVRGRGPGPVAAGAAAGIWTGYRLAHGALRAPPPMPAPAEDWHAMTVERVREMLPTPPPDIPRPPRSRLTSSADLLVRVAESARRSVWEFTGAVRSELSDPLTPVLAIGAAASAVLGSPLDAVLVGSVLGGNATLAASQRVRAERLLRRLLAVQDPPARKLLDDVAGTADYQNVQAADLRPGDVIEVRPGEVAPADGRLIRAVDVEVDESSLTGESLPVVKQTLAAPGATLSERSCMIYAATTVVAGTAVAIVTAVGEHTQSRRAAEVYGGEASTVGLQNQLRELTDRAWPFSLAGGALVSTLGLLRRTGLRQAVSSGVAVSVAAVPEGLPLVATLAQQASARRLTKLGALVRSPRSVEALGRVDVVCFDKTGTLSENRLQVSRVYAAPGTTRAHVLACAAQATPPPNGGSQEHATDVAVMAATNARDVPATSSENLSLLPFRSGRPYSASVSDSELAIKGAPEVVLAGCTNAAAAVQRVVSEMAASGLRVIAVARRDLTAPQARSARADPDAFARLCQRGLQIVGLLGLSDTPRADAAHLLTALRGQHIAVRLITGDHPVTATAIAAELGMPVADSQVISGAEWEALPRRGQEQAVRDRLVFARMSPEHKVQVVQTLEHTGQVCAMVGDGANDAAAIRTATVGIGVAAPGSDPARTAADVMLLDGRIGSLLEAIDEGRQLWRRVQAAVAVLLGGNAGEVAFAIIGSAITGRAPLNTRQLLLVNMLTDALPAAALAVSPPTSRMRDAGRGPDRAALWRTVAVRGATTAAAATAAWAFASVTGRPRRAATVALVALVATQLGQTLLDSHSPLVIWTAIGSLVALAAAIGTPGVSQLLGSTPLGPIGWMQALGTAAVATAVAAIAPRLMSGDEAIEADQSSISTKPARHNTAYNSRNGTVNTRATASVNGSAVTGNTVIAARIQKANKP